MMWHNVGIARLCLAAVDGRQGGEEPQDPAGHGGIGGTRGYMDMSCTQRAGAALSGTEDTIRL
jgi:hypothetical protein